MAPVLQCPDCATKHPIDLASGAAFRCQGCGRSLKVPAQFRPAAADTPTAAAAATPVARTARASRATSAPNGRAPNIGGPAPVAPPSGNGQPLSRRAVRAQSGVVPLWVRLLVWVVAVPLGFVLVFGIARAIGVLTQTQLEDVFLETGWDRFWPVARLLPVVALATAAIVHFSVMYMSRWRVRHSMLPLQTSARPPRERSRPAS
jgi:hypothetical protein